MMETIPPAPKASGPIKLLILAGSLGFFALLGVRIREKTQQQAQIAREREATVARVAAEDRGLPRVEVVRGVKATWEPTVSLEGTLMPWHEADLAFKASGRLSAVRVKVGDQVRSGAVLALLDASEAGAQVRAAQAQLKAAQAQLALAQDTERRTTEMVNAGAVGEATGTQAKGQLSLVMAQVEAAQAQLALASVHAGNHTLIAPFSGLVTRAPTGPGAVVGAGVPLIHLQDNSKLRLMATVGEGDAGWVQVGAEVQIAQEGRVVTGKVIAVLPSVDPSTRRVPLEAEVPNEAPPLLAGSFVRATIRSGAPRPVLRLPATARRPGSQDEIVIVSGGKLTLRKVSFALAPDGALLVRSGLGEEDDVVAAPSAEVKVGQEVLVTAREVVR
ncbi:MAG: efflux RND transporter periplasmic adaptor subunit [Myxococcales bacterium]|nr:efflux RND transporter periplasmic adaptor subunit [Polyangiaceae bacterium]MDW8248735.1 efflux RND transporter periplasmic adaptor subunit [Myxococcales bacterium]